MLKFLRSFLFENQSVRQTIAKNTFWLSVSNVGGRLLRAVVLIYAARILAVSDWGAFSYAFSLIAFFTILTDLGLNGVLLRENAKEQSEEDKAKATSTIFFLKLVLLVISFSIIFFGSPWLTNLEEVRGILPIVALVMVFDTLRDFGFALIRAREKMEWETGLFVLTNLAIVVLGFLALKFSPGLLTFTVAYAAGTGAGMAITYWVARRSFGWTLRGFDTKLMKPILKIAWPFAASGVLGGLLINTDVIVIGYFRDAEQVGYYSAVLRIIMLLYLIPQILVSSIFPILSRVAKNDQEKSGRLMETSLRLLMLASLPISVGGIILAGPIVNLVFGPQYAPAIQPFILLLGTIFFSFAGMTMTSSLFVYDQQNKLIRYSLVGAITNLVLDLALVPTWGIVGCAFATLAVQILTYSYAYASLREILPIRIMQGTQKIVFSTAMMALATWAMNETGIPVVANILVSAGIYGLTLVLLKERLADEVKALFRVGQTSL